jgi:hypothetical protein
MPKDRTSIVVVLRNKNIADRLHNDGFDIVSRQFVGDLIEVLAFHSDEIITLALERWIRELGLTVDEAWALAPTNLRARMGALTSEGFMPGFRYIATADGDGLAQSLLTQADFCASPDATGKIFHIFGPRSYIEVDRNNSAAVERYIGVHAIAVGGGDCL